MIRPALPRFASSGPTAARGASPWRPWRPSASDRKTGSDAERARVNVTRAIRTALRRISEHDPQLGRRLGGEIKTGTFCVYEPAPGDEPAWDLSGPG